MVLPTVVPSAPKTSIGSKIRFVAVRANPMEIASAARTVRTARTARNARDGSTGQVFFRSQIVSMNNTFAGTARLLCGLERATDTCADTGHADTHVLYGTHSLVESCHSRAAK